MKPTGPALRIPHWLLFLLAGVMLVGCSPRRLMVNEFVQMVDTGLPAIEQEDDLQLLASAFPAHIKLLETLLANDPRNTQLLVLLARLCGGYAFAVLETEWEAQQFGLSAEVSSGYAPEALEVHMERYFKKGADYALLSLETVHPGFGQQIASPQQAESRFKALGRSDVPALFWYGFNLGGYVNHNLDSVKAMAKAHLVEKAMRRVVALEPGYFQGGAHLFLMVYYASRSPMIGGNPRLAQIHYNSHKQLVPGSAPLREYYWARFYFVRQQEREAFVQTMTGVAGGPPAGEAAGLLDSVAAVRAGVSLKAQDRFFD